MWQPSDNVRGPGRAVGLPPVLPATPPPRRRGCAADPRVSAAEFETLKEEQDSVSRKFYQDFLEDVVELSQLVTQ